MSIVITYHKGQKFRIRYFRQNENSIIQNINSGLWFKRHASAIYVFLDPDKHSEKNEVTNELLRCLLDFTTANRPSPNTELVNLGFKIMRNN